jgi:hypothetical protein
MMCIVVIEEEEGNESDESTASGKVVNINNYRR